MTAVAFRGVDKVYADGTHAVIGFELEVQEGELMVLVGPSGCGKSTILRLVAGLEEVTDGAILLGDTPIQGVRPQERNVAMVFQNYALYPHMSVFRNMEFPLRMARLPRTERERRVQEAAGLLGLTDQLHRKPAQLSGGQRQRVAMGRAIVREPAAFLMDEPLSNLDAALRVQIRAEIATLQRRIGTTTIYVTHDQVEAMTLGDRVAVLHEGRLQQVGTPDEVYRRPTNVFVAGFVGSPGMNILPGLLKDGTLRVAGRSWPAPPLPAAALQVGAVQVGIRPEDFGDGGGVRLEATAETSESLGHERLVYARTRDGIRIVARLPARAAVQPGERVELGVDPDRLHFFGPGGDALR